MVKSPTIGQGEKMNFLFDLYGTLADIHTDEAKDGLWLGFSALLGEDSHTLVREEYASLCKKYADSREHSLVEFDLLCVFRDMLASRGMDKDEAPRLAREFRVLSREKLKLFPCIAEMLEGLKKRGAGVYLVSNAQSCFTRDELDELGITSLFDGIIISSEAGVKKPHGDIFKIAFEKFGTAAAECFYVGNDLRDDVLGAHGSGIRTIYIETEQSGRYCGLSLPSPDYTVKTHNEMKELLFALTREVEKC